MRPGARVAAAIEILDVILAGEPAEKALTNWARRSRFAGSGDRAAIRDYVFSALRCKRSYAWAGGAQTGRGLMIGALRMAGVDVSTVFTGEAYAPRCVAADEVARTGEPPQAVTLDFPDWLMPELRASLGGKLDGVGQAMRSRAAVYLRSNEAKTTRDAAISALGREGIECTPHDLAQNR